MIWYWVVVVGMIVLNLLKVPTVAVIVFGIVGLVITEVFRWSERRRARRRASGNVPVHDSYDTGGRLMSFEVDSIYFDRGSVARIVAGIPGVHMRRWPKSRFSWLREERFCEWELGGVIFGASEPFGDNSRYWIAPMMPKGWAPQTEQLRNAFVHASLSES